MNNAELKERSIYVTKHGSHAYGLNTPTSDLDIKGVFIGQTKHYLGFLNRVEQIEEKEPNDLVIYEAQKFFRLAADCNPNIIEVLWTAPEDILFVNRLGELMLGIRDRFLSQKAKHTFSGYATAQLRRIQNHYRWITKPPKMPVSRMDYGLPENKQWCAWIDANPTLLSSINPEQAEMYTREKQWREDSREWDHYQTWVQNRNPARSELEHKHGYDTKHGMHLVRLMRMGEEILKTGKVNVKRGDREELLAIRNHGIWPYEKLVEWAQKKDDELTDFYKSGQSPLPKEPNRNVLDGMCMDLIERGLKKPWPQNTIWYGLVTPRQ
jgi:predicted nucleotidyltransferase